MNREELTKLLEIIDAKIQEALAGDSSDGGLIETIRVTELVEEMYALARRNG